MEQKTKIIFKNTNQQAAFSTCRNFYNTVFEKVV